MAQDRATDSFWAETIATALVGYTAVFVGAMSVSPATRLGPIGAGVVAGTATLIAVSVTRYRSRGLANPLVPLALCSIARLSLGQTARLLSAQLLGAFLGAAFARAQWPIEILFPCHGGTPRSVEGLHYSQALVGELVGGFVLLWALLNRAILVSPSHNDSSNSSPASTATFPAVSLACYGLVTGWWVTLQAPLTGSFLNPAVTFATALTSGFHSQVWLFAIGPIAGAWLAAVVYNGSSQPR